MKTIYDLPARHGKNRYGRSFNQLDLPKQVQVVIDELGTAHLSRAKGVGSETVRARAYAMHQFFDELRQKGYAIKTVANLSQKHVGVMVRAWEERGLAAGTIQTRMSILRWFTTAIGKAGMVMDATAYGVDEKAVQRQYVAVADRSWTSHEVFPPAVVAKAKEKDEWVGMQFELMAEFGLRVRESIMLRPHLAHFNGYLRIEEGTKGGRTRLVEVRTERQHEVLERAKVLAMTTAKGRMCPPGRTVAQAKRRVYYMCELLGITKAEAGVTPHGLRHQYANDRFEEVSGRPSAVRGGEPVNDEADREARHQVTQDLGHARLSITTAYTGKRAKGRPRLDWSAGAPEGG